MKIKGMMLLAVGIAVVQPNFAAHAAKADDAALLKKALEDGCKAFVAGDADGSMAPFTHDGSLVVFDITPPQSKNYDQVKKLDADLIGAVDGKPTCEYTSLTPVVLDSQFAYTMGIIHTTGKLKGGGSFAFDERTTDVWKKTNGKWQIIHEHNSVPVDVMTGKADLLSTP